MNMTARDGGKGLVTREEAPGLAETPRHFFSQFWGPAGGSSVVLPGLGLATEVLRRVSWDGGSPIVSLTSSLLAVPLPRTSRSLDISTGFFTGWSSDGIPRGPKLQGLKV